MENMGAGMAFQVTISVTLMLFSGFLFTRVTKLLKLPNVTAYILAGVVIGPCCLQLVPQVIVDGMDFLSDIALAFIAFGTGEFFRFSVLRKNGMRVVIITLLESCVASLFVFLISFFLLRLSLAFSVILSALAAATAPASTMMTIRQTGAKGEFVDILLQVVALDDAVGLVAYSIAVALASSSLTGEQFRVLSVLEPLGINLAAVLSGGLLGWGLKWVTSNRSTDNRLVIALSFLLGFCGICILLDISPLLGCMAMGAVYGNTAKDDELFSQLNRFSPPILLLFFVRSGMCFRIDTLFSGNAFMGAVPLGVVGAVYFLTRILGKYGGAWLGCRLTGTSRKVRNWLGLALIPQAGIAIGLASLGARTLGGDAGSALQTVILASGLLYELAGPGCAKLSLHLSGSVEKHLDTQKKV